MGVYIYIYKEVTTILTLKRNQNKTKPNEVSVTTEHRALLRDNLLYTEESLTLLDFICVWVDYSAMLHLKSVFNFTTLH
jgi:hypothetical protein